MSTRIPVGVLGATGTVGQKFVHLLRDHPLFEVAELVASPRNGGKPYAKACRWHEPEPMPDHLRDVRLTTVEDKLSSPVLFSGLDSSIAGEAEEAYADAGHAVISNSKNHRMDPDVPLVIPEINADHLSLLPSQDRRGWIMTNPNCSTMFLAIAIAPLYRRFGVESCTATTLQAVSGAGYPGVPSMDILGNVVPYISGEEEKMEREALKILGTLRDGSIQEAVFEASATCTRVPVFDGHLESVSIRLHAEPSLDELAACLNDFRGPADVATLPSAPEQPIRVLSEPDRPQPAKDVTREGGMVTWVGRIRPCPVLGYRFMVLGHNTIRGAAGAAILNAEIAHARGYIE